MVVDGVAKDEVVLHESEMVECVVVEGKVAELEPVPHEAYPGGWWYAAGSPYPPGKADTPPTAAMNAKVRNILNLFDRGPVD